MDLPTETRATKNYLDLSTASSVKYGFFPKRTHGEEINCAQVYCHNDVNKFKVKWTYLYLLTKKIFWKRKLNSKPALRITSFRKKRKRFTILLYKQYIDFCYIFSTCRNILLKNNWYNKETIVIFFPRARIFLWKKQFD